MSPQSVYSPQPSPTIVSKRSVLDLPQNGMVVAKCISHSLKLERLRFPIQLHAVQSISKHSRGINAHAMCDNCVTAYLL